MITPINVNNFIYQDTIMFNGEIHYSVYNHNYYLSEDGKIILEECDDDNGFYYYWVDPVTGNTDYIGLVIGCYGIFDSEYDGNIEQDVNGMINIDSDFC